MKAVLERKARSSKAETLLKRFLHSSFCLFPSEFYGITSSSTLFVFTSTDAIALGSRFTNKSPLEDAWRKSVNKKS